MSVVNLKSQGILNSHKFAFVEVDEKTTTVTLRRENKQYQLAIDVFTKEGNFRLGFCDSVFRNYLKDWYHRPIKRGVYQQELQVVKHP